MAVTSPAPQQPPVRIVVAGGNYAGLNTLHHLYAALLADTASNVHITLIDRRDGFVHYIGMTRGLTEPEYGSQLWVPYSDVAWLQHEQIAIKHATVSRITHDCVQLVDGDAVPFDYLVVALGQSRLGPIGVSSATRREFLDELAATNASIARAQHIAVVGGGAVGVEMAADLKCDFPDKHVALVHSRALPIAGPFKDEFRRIAVDILHELGVDVILGERVVGQSPSPVQVPPDEVLPERYNSTYSDATFTLASGREVRADWAISCVGVRQKAALVDLPSSTRVPVFGDDGLRVKATMQVDDPKYANIFAVGDICDRDAVKLAGVAMYGGYIAARNIARLVAGAAPLEDAVAYPPKLMLLMGKDHFALQTGDEIWDTERARQYAHADMGLESCVQGLSLNSTPKPSPL